MLHKIKLFLIHPLLLLAVIAYLECIPYESDLGKKVYHEMPKIGYNFQISVDLAVYYYNGKGKYSYRTADCYFSFGNPAWSAKYEDGGIKKVDAQIANQSATHVRDLYSCDVLNWNFQCRSSLSVT